MSKFCSKCGAETQDGIKFCAGCGTPVETAETPVATATVEAPVTATPAVAKKPAIDLKNKKTLIVVAVAAAVLVILLIVLIFNLLFGGYKAAIKDYVKATSNATSMDLDTVMTYGKGVKMTSKITDKEKIDKRDVETIQEYFEDVEYDGKNYKGADKIKVSSAYIVEVELSIKGRDDDDKNDVNFLVLKVNGDWYVTYSSVDCGDADEYIESLEDELD